MTVLFPVAVDEVPIPIVLLPPILADVPMEMAPVPEHCVLNPIHIEFVPLACPESPRMTAPAAEASVFLPIAMAAVMRADVVADDPIAILSDAPADAVWPIATQ
jgi:hypothetical protein